MIHDDNGYPSETSCLLPTTSTATGYSSSPPHRRREHRMMKTSFSSLLLRHYQFFFLMVAAAAATSMMLFSIHFIITEEDYEIADYMDRKPRLFAFFGAWDIHAAQAEANQVQQALQGNQEYPEDDETASTTSLLLNGLLLNLRSVIGDHSNRRALLQQQQRQDKKATYLGPSSEFLEDFHPSILGPSGTGGGSHISNHEMERVIHSYHNTNPKYYFDTSHNDDDDDDKKKKKKKKKSETRSENEKNNGLFPGCEATVLLLRHCEKGKIREHCSYPGFERSVYLTSLFGNDPSDRWPLPSYIFATNPGGRSNRHKMNFREIELVAPLAQKANNIPVDDSFTEGKESKLAKTIIKYLNTGHMCGKVTVVSWKHSAIGHLARKLGCGPADGCPLDYRGRTFDEAWQIKFVYRVPDHSTRKSLKNTYEPEWNVYGSVQDEGFDPLAVSKQFGDYPAGGTTLGGRWRVEAMSYPERKRVTDTSSWRMTKVGFHNGK